MRITWWGHSTTAIEDVGTRLLTDPVLTWRIGHLRRRRGPAPGPDAADCDAVLISHLHADHLHLTSLPLIAPDAALVVPRGAARLIQQTCGNALADRCIEMAPGNQVRIGAVTVTAVTAIHDGRRLPWSSYSAPALGFRVDGSLGLWFAGDTDLYDDLAAEAGPVEVALVPVGGWGPSLGPGHLDPVRAAEAVRRVGARVAVPVHFGTFWPIGMEWARPDLFLAPGTQFRTVMAAVDPTVRIELLAPGESAELVAR